MTTTTVGPEEVSGKLNPGEIASLKNMRQAEYPLTRAAPDQNDANLGGFHIRVVATEETRVQ